MTFMSSARKVEWMAPYYTSPISSNRLAGVYSCVMKNKPTTALSALCNTLVLSGEMIVIISMHTIDVNVSHCNYFMV